jgi:hypothetical protein
MSKYNSLWEYVQKKASPSFKLSFVEIKDIAEIEIDHSFLNYKKGIDGVWISSRKNFPERKDGGFQPD